MWRSERLAHGPGRSHGALGMVRLRQRCIEDGHQRVANKHGDGTLFLPDRLRQDVEIAVEHPNQFIWRQLLRQPRVAANIGKHHADLSSLAAEMDRAGIGEQLAHHRGVHVASEEALNLFGLALAVAQLGQIIYHHRHSECLAVAFAVPQR